MKRLFVIFALMICSMQANAASRFMVLCVVTCTWDNSNTTIWSATSGGAGGQSAPVAGDVVTLDGSTGGGTVTVNANLAIAGLTTSAFTGTLDFSANNNSLTTSAGWIDGGSGVHTINMGNNTWTFTQVNGTPINITLSANITLNANSSTILLSAVPTGARVLTFGAKTINNLTVTNAAWQPFMIDLNGNNSFTIAGNLALTNVGFVRMPSAGTLTVTGSFTWDGTSTNQGVMLTTNASTSPSTLSVGSAVTLSWLLIQNITKAGASSIICNNCFDGGGNTGITINKPGGGRVIGGWLFDNDNAPRYLAKVA